MQLFGIMLEIVGVVIIIRTELKSSAAILSDPRLFFEDAKWYEKIPLWFAKKFGSRDPLDTEEYIRDTFVGKFYGFTFILLGFIVQGMGLFIK